MNDPADLADMMPVEIARNLRAMAAAKDIQEKRIYSEIVLNLCKSMGVFITAALGPSDDFDDALFADDADDEESYLPFIEKSVQKKKRNRKRKRKQPRVEDDLPF